MQNFEWTQDLSVGVEMIDEQHKQWIRHLNDLAAAIHAREGATRVSDTLGFLIDYTDFHFSAEERKMQETQYPGIESHKARHEELRATLAHLVDDFSEEGATHELADSISTFLGNWLVMHIRNVDTPFGDFLREKGIVISEL